MNLFVRFLLSLCLPFLGGTGHTYAQEHSRNDDYFYAQQVHQVRAQYLITGNLAQQIHYSAFHHERKHQKGIAEDNQDDEDEDDVSTSLKYASDFRSYLASFFYLTSTGDHFCFFKNRLFFDEHIPNCSSTSYITLRVIRV